MTNISRSLFNGQSVKAIFLQAKTNKMRTLVLRRYLLFIVSLFINAFGVAFITKALLGTSPITSITYVLSLFTRPTMGQWTIIINILMVILELPLMSRERLRNERRLYLLQIPVTIFFGLFIDFSMNMLHMLNPATYMAQIVSLLVGCAILAVGIALEVKVNVAMAAGEYFVRLIAIRTKKDFGYVKLGFDSSLVLLSCIVSLIFMHGIYGVREGTVVAALIVGPIVHIVSPFYSFLDKWLDKNVMETQAESATERDGHIVITIAREYGSGGHILGEMLAEKLGLKLYDKEFIRIVAQESGIDKQYIIDNEQTLSSSWLKRLMSPDYEIPLDKSLSPEDVLFVSESKVIQELAERESCIIVGRCADHILKERPNTIKIFCYSDYESAAARCVSEYHIPSEKVEEEIKQTNKSRIAHYEHYTGKKWGDPHNYDLVINTGCIPLQTACGLVADLYSKIKKS